MAYEKLRRRIEKLLGLPVGSTDPERKMTASMRSDAIQQACSYMVMAQEIEMKYVGKLMLTASSLSDDELSHFLNGSFTLYRRYLVEHLSKN